MWGGDGEPHHPGAISPLESWNSRNNLRKNVDTTTMGDFMQLTSLTLNQAARELEVSSAAMETVQIKDKLKKRRMSEGLFASNRGENPGGAVSRSASQRLLITSKPMPPIQSIPTSPEANGAGGRELLENGTDSWSSGENPTEQPPATQQVNEHRRTEPQTKMVPMRNSCIPAKGKDLYFCYENGVSVQMALEGTVNFVRLTICPMVRLLHIQIHVTISKSAQEKMRQKQLKELELLRKEREKEREKERPLKLQEGLQSINPGGTAQGGKWLPLSLGLYLCGLMSCLVSVKQVNRPSLPSIPVIHHDSSFLRHASAYSLPANLLDSPDWKMDLGNGDTSEMRPFSHPEQGLVDALKWLSNNDWQLKEKGLFSVQRLATCHSEVLLCRLHDVSLAVTREVSNLRSKVSRFAISTLAELFRAMKKHMDQEVEEIARVLLQKTGDSSEFIQEAADQSLGVMVGCVTPTRALAALMANGVNHRNPLVRKCAAEHLLSVVEQIGAEKLLSGTRDSMEQLVQMLVKLAQDCNQDTRFYGRKMLNVLLSHPKFDGYLKQSLPSQNLRDVMAAIKQKGMEDNVSEAPSAKGRRESKNSSLTTSLDSLPSDEGLDTLAPPQPGVRRSSIRSLEAMEQLKELNKLLLAKEFQLRMEGVTLLMKHCKSNPQLVSANIIIQIFDGFALRLQDSNKKVNQYALESVAAMIPILKDGLNPVIISMVTIVTDNLNSKNSGIYMAAMKVLDTMITHLDNLLLLQAFSSRVRFLSGRALQDTTDRLSVLVASVYPKKPQAVERHVLPVLGYFLSNMIGNGVLPGRSGNVKTVVSKLTKSLYKQMGSSLEDYTSSQPQHVTKNLRDLLNMELQIICYPQDRGCNPETICTSESPLPQVLSGLQLF
uniref:TOG array regulator of axonemal microtubules 2 n=1 Tax=Sphenodon punctatus TaxID=8508 RepID=A0A8D0L4K8_SPHPU